MTPARPGRWQVAPLLTWPVSLLLAWPAWALDRPPPAAWPPLAQAAPSEGERIPAEVREWAKGATAAYATGDLAEALRLQRRVVEWASSRLEAFDPFRAQALTNLGLLLGAVGQREEAVKPAEEAVRIYRELAKTNPAFLGPLASALNTLGVSYGELGRREEALKPTEEAVRIRRGLAQTNPATLVDLARALNNLGIRYGELGRREEALKPTEEAVRITRELAKTNPAARGDLAKALNNLGNRLSDVGRREQALIAAEEAVRIRRELVQGNPAARGDLAKALNNLGIRYSELGRREQALKPAEEAVRITRELATTNPAYLGDLADFLNNLGIRYSELGRREEALKPMEEGLAITRELAKTNPAFLGHLAMTLTNLGVSYSDLGRREEALKPSQEAVRITRELAQTNPAFRGDLADALNNLGIRLSELDRHAEALEATAEATRIYRELAQTNPAFQGDLAIALNNLGNRLSELGRPGEALTAAEEAVRIRRELAQTNPVSLGDLAIALNNLGIRLSERGRREEALKSTEESVRITRELAKTNPAYLEEWARGTANLANLLIQLGKPAEAVGPLGESVRAEVSFLQRQLPLMPERRRQNLVDTLGSRWQLPFSLANQGEAGASLALYARLNRLGPLQDIERRQGLLARATGAPRQLVDRLMALTAELANPSLPLDRRQRALMNSEELERELFRQLPALRPRLVEIAEVAKWLPVDGVLVEFQRYLPYDPRKAPGQEWGSPRYVALVLDARAKARAIDLGEAEPLERAIASALDHTRLQDPQAEGAWALVADKVFTPLRSSLQGMGHVLISPDGQLHRVPFSALGLLAGDSRWLPGEATPQTIGGGRDLVPVATEPAKESEPVVLADPTTTGWAPLARAASEGQAVAARLGVRPNLGPEANVTALQRARGPKIIHVAGHGYFDPQAKGDPLLASGLVLAGADKARQPSKMPPSARSSPAAAGDDGYLTAKEAARLRLEGTRLVVLSACDTSLGSERTGEGLFGLRRALTVAGARGTLLSLWKVPEHATETFMARFYALLGEGVEPAEAVRRVQAEFRAQPRIDGWKDPYYWAGWQYSGPPDHLK